MKKMASEQTFQKIQRFAYRGEWTKVRKLFKGYVKLNPTDWELIYKVGVLEANGGNYSIAIKVFQMSKDIAPDDSKINANLAQLYSLNDQPEKAWPILEGLAKKIKDSEAIYRQLGLVAHKLNRYEDAEMAYERALELGSEDLELLNNYAVMLQGFGRYSEAIHLLTRAFEKNPSSPEISNNLANLYMVFGQLEEALLTFKRALDQNPKNVSINRNLALLHRNLGDSASAKNAARRAAIADPSKVDGLTIGAELLEHRADLEQAIRLLRFSLSGAPNNIDAVALMARSLRRVARVDEAIEFLKSSQQKLEGAPDIYKVLFELGQAYQSKGNYKKAFSAFTSANKAQGKGVRSENIDPRRTFARLRELKLILPKTKSMAVTKSIGNDGTDDPVFMVGFPRSGTTLLDQVLDSHPRLSVLEERPLVSGIIRRMTSHGLKYPLDLPNLDEQTIAGLREGYFDDRKRFLEIAPGTVFIDKMPLNINEAILINKVFPKARFIVVLRDPCDVCLSCFTQAFELNDWMAVFNDIASTAELYNEVFDLWYDTVRNSSIPYHEVRYEELVNDLPATATKVLSFLNLPWSDNLKTYYKHARERGYLATPSHSQVTQPVYQHAVERWKLYGDDMKPIEKILERSRRRMGYL